MDLKCIAVVLACALFACVLGAEPPKPTTTPTADTTTVAPITTTTSAPSTTTTAAPSTTTAAPSTTTAAPATTTSAPVTTPAPPTPSDGRGNWSVSDTNVTCIVAQMVISTKINYELQAPNKTASVEVSIPVSAQAEGSCDADKQSVKLTWGQNSVDIMFGKNITTKMYFVQHIALVVFADNKTFPNISSDLVNKTYTFESSSELFKTSFNQSYRCIREESLPLSKTGNLSAILVLDKVQLEAFRTKSDKVFATAQDCELDTPDIVPIAVGCALAALVFVVLVAYLVGRRRSQARGYVSM
ncbi:Lysosome-associated membrane glycoprotein 1 [Frankliniella fusca]|uniref:Lysosome-associated membrane glycoprotein 5 n=1 Tax=Frankliniella fusca TaxID=407009 RepID=A0AAE1HN93_9NEOP|nr:Lysosome-associated membrane glycoprotein 1 [Frankliniella fusca]